MSNVVQFGIFLKTAQIACIQRAACGIDGDEHLYRLGQLHGRGFNAKVLYREGSIAERKRVAVLVHYRIVRNGFRFAGARVFNAYHHALGIERLTFIIGHRRRVGGNGYRFNGVFRFHLYGRIAPYYYVVLAAAVRRNSPVVHAYSGYLVALVGLYGEADGAAFLCLGGKFVAVLNGDSGVFAHFPLYGISCRFVAAGCKADGKHRYDGKDNYP